MESPCAAPPSSLPPLASTRSFNSELDSERSFGFGLSPSERSRNSIDSQQSSGSEYICSTSGDFSEYPSYEEPVFTEPDLSPRACWDEIVQAAHALAECFQRGSIGSEVSGALLKLLPAEIVSVTVVTRTVFGEVMLASSNLVEEGAIKVVPLPAEGTAAGQCIRAKKAQLVDGRSAALMLGDVQRYVAQYGCVDMFLYVPIAIPAAGQLSTVLGHPQHTCGCLVLGFNWDSTLASNMFVPSAAALGTCLGLVLGPIAASLNGALTDEVPSCGGSVESAHVPASSARDEEDELHPLLSAMEPSQPADGARLATAGQAAMQGAKLPQDPAPASPPPQTVTLPRKAAVDIHEADSSQPLQHPSSKSDFVYQQSRPAASGVASSSSAAALALLLERTRHQQPFWLSFQVEQMEASFVMWQAAQQCRMDIMVSFLMLVYYVGVGSNSQYGLFQHLPRAHTLCCLGFLLPPLLIKVNTHMYVANREKIFMWLSTAMLAYWSLLAVPTAVQVGVPAALSNPVWAARLTLVEAMFMLPLCLMVRFSVFMPMHVASWLGLGLRLLPSTCNGGAVCGFATVFAQILVGIAAPAAVIRALERRARRSFLQSDVAALAAAASRKAC